MNGVAQATKIFERNKEPITVREYRRCDYFGELTLITEEARAANIIAIVKL
jgi:CRP-like cAMP-binding protein